MCTLLFMLIFVVSVNAQDFEAQQEAFAKSYELEKEGEYKKATTHIKKVYDEKSYEINLRLGWLNYLAGLHDESLSHYQKALNLMPYSEEARLGLVLPAAATGKWELVTKTYKEILRNNPQNTTANYRMGLILYGQKEYDAALTHFKKVTDLYPFDYDSLLMLAWTNFQLGKTREAKILFNKVLLYSPEDKSATEGLSLMK